MKSSRKDSSLGVMARALATSAILFLLVASPAVAEPPSPLTPYSDAAENIANLFNVVLALALFVFLFVEGLILFVVFRFRRRAAGGPEPAQIHGNVPLEISWSIAPAIILAILFFLTFQALQNVQRLPADALQVEVIGHQWWWEFRYPEQGVTTATQLVVPVGKSIVFAITSMDVIHSFWVPQLGGKVDAIPGQVNTYWFKVEEPGEYHGQCAEFCGIGHPYMPIRVKAVPEEEFAAWVQVQLLGPDRPTDPLLARGLELIEDPQLCAACHTIAGTQAQGKAGPDLTGFGSRPFVGGTVENTPENLARWLDDPRVVKPEAKMPDYNLSSEDIQALIAYLESLK